MSILKKISISMLVVFAFAAYPAYSFIFASTFRGDKGCAPHPIYHTVYQGSCMSAEKADEISAYCMNHSCGLMPEPAAADKCYQKYGYCEKSGNDCNWRKSDKLDLCIKNIVAAPAQQDWITEHNSKPGNMKIVPFEEWNKRVQKQAPQPNN